MPPYPSAYLQFVTLFNERKFFEAHEVLEILWRQENGQRRDFYQGLIQMAAAFVHRENDNAQGVERLYAAAAKRLSFFSPETMGLDVEKFLTFSRESLLAKDAYPQLYLRGTMSS